MAKYITLDFDAAEKAIAKVDGLEPIIVDGKLMAFKIGSLRISPKKGGELDVFEEQP